MLESEGGSGAGWGLLAVVLLVLANGFFVAAEFALVAVRRSRVAELADSGRLNASVLLGALDRLDSHLAATQLGITISSLALGWIGEPALAHLIEPLLTMLPLDWARIGSHTIAVVISFVLITALHIVLGELAPKSLALQRSETTALWVVRPLSAFLFLLRPAITVLNGMGNLVLKLAGLAPGAGEASLHSSDELKLLVRESHSAGILDQSQQDVVSRVLDIGDRWIADIMTARPEMVWLNANDSPEAIRAVVRECRHDQLIVARGNLDDPLGIVLKKDLLDQMLDGHPMDPIAAMREPLLVNESSTVLGVLEQFKKSPARAAMIVDEYGVCVGIVTQTDLLEAMAGTLPDSDGEEPEVVEQPDGTLLIDGLAGIHEILDRLDIEHPAALRTVHTVAGLALLELGHLPTEGESFEVQDWRFTVLAMDGRRIDRMVARRMAPVPTADSSTEPP